MLKVVNNAPTHQVMPKNLRPFTATFTPPGRPQQTDGQPDWFGDDLVLTDVLSFNVRYNSGYYYFGYGDGYSDSYSDINTSSPYYYSYVRALQITIRVWDAKTQLTRQTTIVQDM
jgi:hypothetical protein